jgi:hypothetical protein
MVHQGLGLAMTFKLYHPFSMITFPIFQSAHLKLLAELKQFMILKAMFW